MAYAVLQIIIYLDFVQNGATAVMVAAQNGHCEVVRMLLEAKADINIKANVSDINFIVFEH